VDSRRVHVMNAPWVLHGSDPDRHTQHPPPTGIAGYLREQYATTARGTGQHDRPPALNQRVPVEAASWSEPLTSDS
jgi:hypothetical protein